MNCPRCGGDNREGARFCRHCGQEMDLPPQREAAVAEPVPDNAEAGQDEEALPETESPAEADQEPSVAAEAGEALDRGAESAADSEPEPGAEGEPALAEQQAAGEEAKAETSEVVEPEADEIEVGEAGPVVEGQAGALDEEPLAETAGPEEPPPAVWPEGEEEKAAPPLGETDEVLAFWREEAEPLAAVSGGTVIAGRYLVVEALDVQEAAILYAARDLQRCWQCGFEGNAADDAFCAQCGAALDRKPKVRLLEVADEGTVSAEGEAVERLVHEGRTFVVLAEPRPEPQAEPSPPGIRLVVGQRSDAGQVRELNEDGMLVLALTPTYESRMAPVLGLYAVADGMGGHEGGEVASKLALQVLAQEVTATIVVPEIGGRRAAEEDVVACLQQAAVAANDAVYLARQKRDNDMGTTLTAALIRDDRLFLAHVGDSRAYRWNADGLEQLTVDHSVVASMIASGRAAPEEIYTHPHRSVIYRCIGDQPVVEVDTAILPLAPGDRIVVCSDGLWEMIRDEGIEDVMLQEADPQAACDLLVKHANVAGGDDNISVIMVQVESL